MGERPTMEDETRSILPDTIKDENRKVEGLGTKLARRFAGRGLDFDIPEIRGEPLHPAPFQE
jgi:plasmid stability protein